MPDSASILAELDVMTQRIRDLRVMLAAETPAQQLGSHAVNLHVLKQHVADAYHVPYEWMTVRHREAQQVWPRQVAMFLAREVLKYSLHEIGRAFRRDHGTIMHASEAVRARMLTSKRDYDFVTALRTELDAKFNGA
jgi:chromosomal replication initiation ATPase DnaA